MTGSFYSQKQNMFWCQQIRKIVLLPLIIILQPIIPRMTGFALFKSKKSDAFVHTINWHYFYFVFTWKFPCQDRTEQNYHLALNNSHSLIAHRVEVLSTNFQPFFQRF
jgi:hypothetical protein